MAEGRGLKFSPGSPRRYLFVVGRVSNGAPQMLTLHLELPSFFQLVRVHAAILLAPSVAGLLCDANLPYRIHAHHSLPIRHIDMAQIGDNLLGIVTFDTHLGPQFTQPWDGPISLEQTRPLDCYQVCCVCACIAVHQI